MITKKIKCSHCSTVIEINELSTTPQMCGCSKIKINNGMIVEGMQGIDWVDVSPKLLNE